MHKPKKTKEKKKISVKQVLSSGNESTDVKSYKARVRQAYLVPKVEKTTSKEVNSS